MARPIHSSVGRPVVLDKLKGAMRELNGTRGTISKFDPDLSDKKEHDYLVVGTNGKVLGWFSRKEFKFLESTGA